MYFECSLHHPHSGLTPEAANAWKRMAATVEGRMGKLERALAISGINPERFAMGAEVLFNQGIVDDLTEQQVADLATSLSSHCEAQPTRIDFAGAETVADLRFVTEAEQNVFWRSVGIGGSDVAAIQGISPFRGPRDVYYDKTGPERVAPTRAGTQFIFDYGHAVEDVIIADFCRQYGFTRIPETRQFRHRFYTELTANVDGVLRRNDNGDLYLFEAKTANVAKREHWLEGPPDYYVTQCRHYMAVLDDDRIRGVYIGCCFGNNPSDNVYYLVERDFDAEQQQIEDVTDFWSKYVLTSTEPPLCGNPAIDWSYVNRKRVDAAASTSIPEAESLCEEWLQLRDERLAAKETVARIERQQEEVAVQIQELMGENSVATCGRYTATQKETRRKTSINANALRLKYPAAFRDCKEVGESSRRFAVKSV